MKIVLVDDHPLVRAAVRRAIADTDIEVVGEAGTAEEAVAAAADLSPDLVLLDINLPGATGLEVIPELKLRAPATKVVMLTVSTSDADVDEALVSGAEGYLTKDLTPDALRRSIRGIQHGHLAMPRQMANDCLVRLARAAARAKRHLAGDSASLTGREREVLRLLSEGLTNRGIADVLSLSPRTIERHVSSILAKLEAPNRAAAATYLADAPAASR